MNKKISIPTPISTFVAALRQEFNNIEWHSFWDETKANEALNEVASRQEWLQKEFSYEVPKAADEYRVCAECSACVRGYFKSSPDTYVCTGARHPFVVESIDEPCLLKRR